MKNRNKKAGSNFRRWPAILLTLNKQDFFMLKARTLKPAVFEWNDVL